MVGRAALFADTASGHSRDDLLVGHFDIDDPIDHNAGSVQSLGLRNGSRETVEDKTVFAVFLCQTILDDTDDDLIRDKLAGVHKGFRLEAHFRAAFQRLSQNIARRNGGYSEMFADNFCLGAFTGTRCT